MNEDQQRWSTDSTGGVLAIADVLATGYEHLTEERDLPSEVAAVLMSGIGVALAQGVFRPLGPEPWELWSQPRSEGSHE